VSDSQLSRAEELFRSALALPAHARDAHLREACGGDDRLRRLVERLLALDASEHALDVSPLAASTSRSAGDIVPESIGRYRVLRVLGEGGMGTVYEAQQEEPRRVVALKVLRSIHAGPETLARFRREAQVLGSLQHPGIAQVFEAGTGPLVVGGVAITDVPFLAMELVRGEPLNDAVARRALSPRALLELFARVCDAVQHAHEKNVVHRDLKPSNVLVVDASTNSGDASTTRVPLAPKVLDFGIARLVEPGVESSIATQTGQVLGTLAYMAPEQARGDTSGVAGPTDVWALGVVLFELCTARRPFAIDGLPLAAAIRRIEQDEPPRPSSIDTRWRGDVDRIVAKCLEKDRARRYASVAELADDVRRHLADEPIRARPPSATYLVGKYARRHRALVTAVGAALVTLVAGLSYGLVKARGERDEARAATDFLVEILRTPDANRGDKDITLRDALGRVAPQIEARFTGKPELEARLRAVFGDAFDGVDDLEASRAMYAEASRLYAATLGPEAEPTLAARARLGASEAMLSDFDVAERTLLDVLAVHERSASRGSRAHVSAAVALGDAYSRQGRDQDAADTYRAALALLGDTERPLERAELQLGLANALSGLGAIDEADALFEAAQPVLERELGASHRLTISAVHALGILRATQGRFDEAGELGRRALDDARRAFGPDSHLALRALDSLATLELQRGNLEEAEVLLSENAERTERARGLHSADTLQVLNNLAVLYRGRRQPERAEAIYRRIVPSALTVLGRDSWIAWAYAVQLGSTLLELRCPLEAEPWLRDAHFHFERLLGPGHAHTRATGKAIAGALRMQDRLDESAEWTARAEAP